MADARNLPEWLQEPTTATRASHRAIMEQAAQHPFVALGLAMREKNAAEQECLLNKFYLFMCDCLPGGLAGDLAHIYGNDVMRYMLCQKGKVETAPSRHKITRQAEVAFAKLEGWMAMGKSWRDARKRSQEDNRRKRNFAPGLHSPAALLAVLIISHPDDKYRSWIVDKLQVEWMLTQDRTKLEVKHGFWKGIHAGNLYDVFGREEERETEGELLADYTKLFGQDFAHARRDIQPYLPGWAQGVVQLNAGGNQDENGDDGPAADNLTFAERDILALRRALGLARSAEPPEAESELRMLEIWLFQKLASEGLEGGPATPLPAWCRHWEGKWQEAKTHQEQLLAQSLFLQSLRRLYSLRDARMASVGAVAASQVPVDQLYMVVDMDDGERRPPVPEALEQSTLDFLNANPPYAALKEADTRLLKLVRDTAGPAVRSCLQTLLKAQASALSHTTKQPNLNRYFHGVIAFRAARIHALLHGLQEEPLPKDRLEGWRGRRDLLVQPETAAALQLTDWQLHAVLLPGADSERVLTRWQDRILRVKQGLDQDGEHGPANRSQPMPVSCQMFPDGTFSTEARKVRTECAALCMLFGRVLPPKSQTPASTAPLGPASSPTPTMSTIIASATPARSSDNTAGLSRSVVGQKISMPPLAGRSHASNGGSPAKRTASPVDPRPAKVARLGGLREEMDDLRVHMAERLDGLTTQNEVMMLNVTSLPINLAGMYTDLAKLVREMSEGDQARVGEVKTEIQTRLDEMRSAMERFHGDGQAQLVELKSNLERLHGHSQAQLIEFRREMERLHGSGEDHMSKVESNMERLHGESQAQLRAVQADLGEVKALLAKVQRPESGLVQDCPAPAGTDQKDYESHLHRACAYYSYHAWSLTDNHGPFDADAFAETKASFPDLDGQALFKALEHFHRQLYNRSHSWGAVDIDGNMEITSGDHFSVPDESGEGAAGSVSCVAGVDDECSPREFFF